MIPEEFPGSHRLSLWGAWWLAKKLISGASSAIGRRQLGAVSVPVDKTGNHHEEPRRKKRQVRGRQKTAAWYSYGAGQTDAYDPMEKAMLEYCREVWSYKENLFRGTLIKEAHLLNESRREWGSCLGVDGNAPRGWEGSRKPLNSVSENERRRWKRGRRAVRRRTCVITRRSAAPGSMKIFQTLCWVQPPVSGLAGLGNPPREGRKIRRAGPYRHDHRRQ